MSVKHRASNLLFVGGFLLAPGIALSQDATMKPHVPLEKSIGQVTPTGPVPSLAVLNAAGAKLEGGKLTLTGVAPNSIVFADRPVRAAGHVMTEQFIMQWDEGKDSFAKDPPNATVSVLGGDGSKVSDAVVTLKTPKLEGGNLTFDVVVLEGSLAGSSGPAALFIDRFGAPSAAAASTRAALEVSTPAASTPRALAATVAARGPAAAIGTPPSIVAPGMGRVPGWRLALPPGPRWEQPRRRTLTLDMAAAACAAIIPMGRATEWSAPSMASSAPRYQSRNDVVRRDGRSSFRSRPDGVRNGPCSGGTQ